jgi:hypothetical protein
MKFLESSGWSRQWAEDRPFTENEGESVHNDYYTEVSKDKILDQEGK